MAVGQLVANTMELIHVYGYYGCYGPVEPMMNASQQQLVDSHLFHHILTCLHCTDAQLALALASADLTMMTWFGQYALTMTESKTFTNYF